VVILGKEISHIILAEQSARLLENPEKDEFIAALGDFPHVFHFGSIAADTFFYGMRIPFLEAGFPCCGDRFHGAEGNDTSLTLLHMLRELKSNPRDPMFREKLAFVCGLLTHIALDTVLHPCVYYFSGNYYHESPEKRAMATTRHRLIESWLDLHFLRKTFMPIGEFRLMDDIRRNSRLNLTLLRFFFKSFAHAEQADESLWKYLQRGYNVQMFLNSKYSDASWGRMVGALNRILKGRLNTFMALFYPWDYLEIPPEIMNFEFYRHPVTGEELPGNFDKLWEAARARSLDFLEAVREYIFHGGDQERLGSVIKGYSLSMGLVGVPATDAGYFDSVPMDRIWAY
jgi:hypothetical protein